MSRRLKQVINIDKALLEFSSSDYIPKVINSYQIRVRARETKFDEFWDWYHTTGSLVHTTERGSARVEGVYLTATSVVDIIYNKYLCYG